MAAPQRRSASGTTRGSGRHRRSRFYTPGATPPPLAWKSARFPVLIFTRGSAAAPRVIEVRGRVAHPFGVFRGDAYGFPPEGQSYFSLVHLPTSRVMATLRYQGACVAMAEEFAPLRVPWGETDVEKVVEGAPDQRKVQEIYFRYRGRW